MVGIGDRAGRGTRLTLLALAAPPRGVAVPAPIAEELLTGLGEMIEHPSEKLEDVPTSHRLATGVLAPGSGTVDDLIAGLVSVAATPRRAGARQVCRVGAETPQHYPAACGAEGCAGRR